MTLYFCVSPSSPLSSPSVCACQSLFSLLHFSSKPCHVPLCPGFSSPVSVSLSPPFLGFSSPVSVSLLSPPSVPGPSVAASTPPFVPSPLSSSSSSLPQHLYLHPQSIFLLRACHFYHSAPPLAFSLVTLSATPNGWLGWLAPTLSPAC